MTYSEAIQFLYDLRMFGAKFGLENTFKLAALAGDPQQKLRFIHIAGTNGKGSTCAMLESIYRTAGLRVGLFTSPHLVSFSERIQVNRQLISDDEVIALVREMQQLLKQFPATEHPTFFEVVTVMALKYFVQKQCDLVIWETGLGGRLDATNIVTPLASVITNIQYDHQKWLGETLPQIAFEKAGIIKSGVPVVTATDEPSALRVIREVAEKQRAALMEIKPADPYSTVARTLHLSLAGDHQKINAALAIATVRILNDQIPVSEDQLHRGLENVFWPGRLQVLKRGQQTILLDGAHNPAGVGTLVHAVQKDYPASSRTLVLGALNDKDWKAMAGVLAPLANRILLVPVHTDRTVSPADMVAGFSAANPRAEVIACDSLATAFQAVSEDPLVVVTGSLYLIGEAMELLGVSPGKNERGLNEWQAAASKEK